MKPRIALVRGPNLNAWETQNLAPLCDKFEIVGFASYAHNFDISQVPFEVRKLVSFGQLARARILREPMNRIWGDYHDLQGLTRALKGFDIVHCAETMYFQTYQAARAKKALKFKLIVTVWENIPFLYDGARTVSNKKTVFDAVDLLLPVSNRSREALCVEGAPAEKIRVQMPGLDLEHFRPRPKDMELLQRFGCHAEDLIILFVANLYREKGIYDLLYAFRMLLDRRGMTEHVKLLIAGKGRERAGVLETIARLRLSDDVTLIGTHPYGTMPQIHNLADVFVLPSIPTPQWQEQFGYVLIESMACAKPVVSTLTGSIPEVVGDSGLLVQPNDPLSLADALEHLIKNPAARSDLSRRARDRAEQLFDVRKVSEHFGHHYLSILGSTV